MYHANNTIDRSCFNHAIVNVNSCIGAKLVFLQTLGVDIFKHKSCDAIKQVPQSRITVEQQADIENLRNLMFMGSENFVCLHCILINCHHVFYCLFLHQCIFIFSTMLLCMIQIK